MDYDGLENPSIADWIEKIPIKDRGLDLLGLRNSVLSIGNVFLSGVTTITPAIRNLSYRCWIIWIYAEWNLPYDNSIWKSFRERVESAFALSNVAFDANMFGIIGLQKAQTLISENNGEVELVDLVKSQKAYATYANISEQLGLTIEGDDILPSLTKERGIPLAQEFNRIISITRFFQSLKLNPELNTVSYDILRELGEKIRMDFIPEEESELLISALCPRIPLSGKYNEFYRIATYSYLLQIAEAKEKVPEEKDFFYSICSKEKHPIEMFEFVKTGWLVYLMRDVIAVTHEYLFEEIYKEVSSNFLGIDEDELIENILEQNDEIIEQLERLNLISSSEEYKNLTFSQLLKSIRNSNSNYDETFDFLKWSGELTEENIIESASSNKGSAIYVLIGWCIVYLRLKKLIQNGKTNELITLFSERSRQLNFMEVILPKIQSYREKNTTIIEVLGDIMRLTLNQHFKIAWLRYSNDPVSIAVVYKDENIIKERRNFKAGRIQSRLRQALGWLKQLNLINEKGITSRGIELVDSNIRVLTEAE